MGGPNWQWTQNTVEVREAQVETPVAGGPTEGMRTSDLIQELTVFTMWGAHSNRGTWDDASVDIRVNELKLELDTRLPIQGIDGSRALQDSRHRLGAEPGE